MLPGVRGAPPAAALVEEQHVVGGRVEDPTMIRVETAAWSAVEEDGGFAVRVADQFPVDALAVADVEHALLVGLDLRVERSHVDLR